MILRNIQNNDPYLSLGENRYKNLRTGREGVVDEEMAEKVFVINIEATALYNENPLLEDLIKRVNLKFEK